MSTVNPIRDAYKTCFFLKDYVSDSALFTPDEKIRIQTIMDSVISKLPRLPFDSSSSFDVKNPLGCNLKSLDTLIQKLFREKKEEIIAEIEKRLEPKLPSRVRFEITELERTMKETKKKSFIELYEEITRTRSRSVRVVGGIYGDTTRLIETTGSYDLKISKNDFLRCFNNEIYHRYKILKDEYCRYRESNGEDPLEPPESLSRRYATFIFGAFEYAFQQVLLEYESDIHSFVGERSDERIKERLFSLFNEALSSNCSYEILTKKEVLMGIKKGSLTVSDEYLRIVGEELKDHSNENWTTGIDKELKIYAVPPESGQYLYYICATILNSKEFATVFSFVLRNGYY